jgi:hypothetical protein
MEMTPRARRVGAWFRRQHLRQENGKNYVQEYETHSGRKGLENLRGKVVVNDNRDYGRGLPQIDASSAVILPVFEPQKSPYLSARLLMKQEIDRSWELESFCSPTATSSLSIQLLTSISNSFLSMLVKQVPGS